MPEVPAWIQETRAKLTLGNALKAKEQATLPPTHGNLSYYVPDLQQQTSSIEDTQPIRVWKKTLVEPTIPPKIAAELSIEARQMNLAMRGDEPFVIQVTCTGKIIL